MRKILILFFSILSLTALAEIKIDSFFSDNMILPRNKENKIWGEATPYSKITVTFNKIEKITTADKNGDWDVLLSPVNATTNAVLSIKGDNSLITIKNIAVGDIWLCAGQSNMNYPLNKSIEHNKAYKVANNYPNLRLLSLNKNTSATLKKFTSSTGWMVSNKNNIKNFSAVACFFGLKLSDNLDIPIGLIQATTDDNKIQAWLSESAVNENSTILNYIDKESYNEKTLAGHKKFVLFNEMINPLKNIKFAGYIWYHGESNISEYSFYKEAFPFMVKSWKTFFNTPDAPFIFAQLTPYNYVLNMKNAAKFRKMQEESVSLISDSAMIGTIDVGRRDKIKPPRKQVVSERFANAALNLKYGKNIPYIHPTLYKAEQISENEIILTFKNAKAGLKNKSYNRGIVIREKSGLPLLAESVYVAGDKIVLQNVGMLNPEKIEFSQNEASPIRIWNSDGLPPLPNVVTIEKKFTSKRY